MAEKSGNIFLVMFEDFRKDQQRRGIFDPEERICQAVFVVFRKRGRFGDKQFDDRAGAKFFVAVNETEEFRIVARR